MEGGRDGRRESEGKGGIVPSCHGCWGQRPLVTVTCMV